MFGSTGISGFSSAGGSGGGGDTALPPLIGIVGDGGPNDPDVGAVDFQSDDLIGLGATNGGKIVIEIDNNLLSNFGSTSSFNFDDVTGTISGITWVAGSGLYIDLNQ